MNILVTGATGFLGQKVALRLVKEGHNVVGIGRNQEIGNILLANGISFVSMNLQDEKAINQICKDKDYIFHCGALSSVWGEFDDFYEANILGTKYLLESALEHGVKRFIHVSTPSIYFNLEHANRLNVFETDFIPQPPINYYASTKLQAEVLVRQAFDQGLPVITIRPRGLFGPGDNAIIPRLIRANSKIGVPMINGGKSLVDITYVENVVDALLLCMESPEHTLGKHYNITNGEPLHLRTILQSLFDELGVDWKKRRLNYTFASHLAGQLESFHKVFLPKKEPILTRYSLSVLSNSQTLNISAARTDLGYEPRVSIEEGIKEFVKWWKERENGC